MLTFINNVIFVMLGKAIQSLSVAQMMKSTLDLVSKIRWSNFIKSVKQTITIPSLCNRGLWHIWGHYSGRLVKEFCTNAVYCWFSFRSKKMYCDNSSKCFIPRIIRGSNGSKHNESKYLVVRNKIKGGQNVV